MWVLDRYLLIHYLKVLMLAMGVLLALYLTIDFVEQMRKYLTADGNVKDIVIYLALKLPTIVYQMAPLAILIGTLFALGSLSFHNELTAIRAGGINLIRVTVPFLGCSLGVSLALLMLDYSFKPTTSQHAYHILKTLLDRQPDYAQFRRDHVWLHLTPTMFLNAQLVDFERPSFIGVSVYHLNRDFSIREVVEAQELRYNHDHWALISGIRKIMRADGGTTMESIEYERVALPDRPEDLRKRLTVEAKNLTFPELKTYISRLKRNGYPIAHYSSDLYGRYAFPFASLVMTILAIAVVLTGMETRKSHMARSVGLTLLIGFPYWIIHSVALGLGRGSVLHPLLAGWTANLLFLVLGIYLLSKVRQ